MVSPRMDSLPRSIYGDSSPEMELRQLTIEVMKVEETISALRQEICDLTEAMASASWRSLGSGSHSKSKPLFLNRKDLGWFARTLECFPEC